MGDIYWNSFLTIATSKGDDSFSGCFNQESISSDRLQRPNTSPAIQALSKSTSRLNRIAKDVVPSTDNGEKSTVIIWYEAVKTEPLPLGGVTSEPARMDLAGANPLA
jgi:hypothetical protein